MSAIDAILRSRPLTTFKFNTSTSVPEDITGRGKTATRTGTAAQAQRITTAASASQKFWKNDTYLTTAWPGVFVNGAEYQQFTLAAWFMPALSTGNQAIMAHYSTNITDGLYYDGSSIIFEVDFTGGTSAIASWKTPDFKERWYVAGVYTGNSVKLFINGELVSETELTDAQKATTFLNASTTIYTGITNPATAAAVIDLPSVYLRAVSGDELKMHFDAGSENLSALNSAGYFNASHAFGVDAERNIAMEREWTTSDDFQTEDPYKVAIEENSLTPTFSGTTSIAGDWIASFPINTFGAAVQGVKAEWDASGTYTVSASLDSGSNWTALTNGKLIPNTLPFTPSVPLMIKVSFTGGISGDTSELRSIKLVGYSDLAIKSTNTARALTIVGDVTTNSEANEPIEQNTNAGFGFNGGYVQAAIDTQDQPTTLYGVGMWVRWDAVDAVTELLFGWDASNYIGITSTGVVTIGGTALSLYINGVPAASGAVTLTKGVYYHIFAKVNAGTNVVTRIGSAAAGSVTFKGDMASLDLFSTLLTDAQVALLYSTYAGTTVGTVTDANLVTIAEDMAELRANKDAWAITSSS